MNNLHRPERHLKKKVFHEYHDNTRMVKGTAQKELVPAKVNLKNKTLLKRYVAYLRSQDIHTQRVHAFSISGVICFFIAVLWLHFVYGWWGTSASTYDPTIPYEEKVLTESPTSTPNNSFRTLFQNTLTQLKNIRLNQNDTASDTQTFDRASSTGDK